MTRKIFAVGLLGMILSAAPAFANPHAGGVHVTHVGATHIGPAHAGPNFNGPAHFGPTNFNSIHVGATNFGAAGYGHLNSPYATFSHQVPVSGRTTLPAARPTTLSGPAFRTTTFNSAGDPLSTRSSTAAVQTPLSTRTTTVANNGALTTARVNNFGVRGGYPIGAPAYRYNGGGWGPGFAAGLGIGLAVPLAARAVSPYGYGYGGYGYPAYGYSGYGNGGGYGYPAASYGYGGYGPPYPQAAAPFGPPLVAANGLEPPLANGAPLADTGLKVVEVFENTSAQNADLRAGDVILGVGDARTQNFEELRQAIASAKGPVDLVIVNSENGKVERLPINPADGKLGVSVVPFELK